MLGLLPIVVAALVVAAIAITAGLALHRRGRAYLIAVAVAIASLTAVACLFWKPAILATAILSVCLLGLAVMFGQVTPKRAIVGAAVGFALLFVFTWLAQQLAEVFLYETEPPVIQQFRESMPAAYPFGLTHLPPIHYLTPVGIGCLLASVVSRRARALWLFAGMTLILISAPAFVRIHGICFDEFIPVEPWVVALAVILLAVAIAFRAINASNHSHTR